jgi:hexosaminidase
LDEVVELFPSPYIHVGGDECPKKQWKESAKAQARMKELGLKHEDELQSWFIRQMGQHLAKRGRRLIGWDEIREGGLAPGAIVMSWRGMAGGIAAAKEGHDVIMSPNDFTYFDYYQSKDTTKEPLAIGGYLPLEKVYAFDPIPPELSPAESGRVLGGQGQIWTEYIPDGDRVEYMAFPRACALAEVLWSPATGRSWDDFSRRLPMHLDRLTARGVKFRRLEGGRG